MNKMGLTVPAVAAAAMMAVAIPQTAVAQTISEDELREYFEFIEQTLQPQRRAAMVGIPTGTTTAAGSVFASVTGTNVRVGYDNNNVLATSDELDGSISVGAGFGDAARSVGAEAVLNINSTELDNFADSGSLSFKVSRQLAGGSTPTFIAVGANGVAGWGDSEGIDPSFSLTLSSSVNAGGYPLLLSAGVATDIRDNGRDDGAYAGIGMGFTPEVGGSIGYYAEESIVGVSIAPASLPAWEFNASIADAFDERGARRAVLSATWTGADMFGGM